MKTTRIKLALGILLAAIAAAVLTSTLRLPLEQGLQQASMLLLGLAAMAALASFAGTVESSANAPLVQFPSNDRRLNPPGQARAADNIPDRRERRQSPTLWGPSTDDLLEEDPALALAKLRIDLEGELRRIAQVRKLPLEARHAPIHQLVDALLLAHLLDPDQDKALNGVLRDCNAAIHGTDMTAEAAGAVIETGARLLGTLRHL
ncbi:hypothetical protein H3H37_00175 [Duganella sp. LX20W]|uniref:DUF4145 domain-containing protein n=1 Tax=Rugamonas brunnea TaxID=2758569 RepID=A0A7W2EN16_9BURK|nr:hypothetical protein [Rugamonas brunnea]MBA5635484.1 hypothetical protein [Rugamonas brunnea]